MNWLIISAGLVSAFTTIGHFVIGTKEYLWPMLEAEFDDIPKHVMQAVFHYVSVFLISSTVALLGIGFGWISAEPSQFLVRYIALNYAAFAIWQVVIALRSGIPRGMIKMFQWVFFVVISVLAWLGT